VSAFGTTLTLRTNWIRWFSAIDTLAKLHSIDPDAIGLGNYGKGKEFYQRQYNTFQRIEAQQAVVKDKDTGKQLGRAHERFDEMVNFVRTNVPGERLSIIHGDFKFNNMVNILAWFAFHQTYENRFSILQNRVLQQFSTGSFPLLVTPW
jgi:aminoglycoside phosphotransferase (APT) family kinase protein